MRGQGLAVRAPAAAAAGPYRALVHNQKLLSGFEKGPRWDPAFWYLFPEGYYPVHVVADVFVQCAGGLPELVFMSRRYRRTDLNYSKYMRVEVLQGYGGAPVHTLPPGVWEDSGHYESSSIGRYALPPSHHYACEQPWPSLGGAPPRPVYLRVTYNGTQALFNATRSPEPPPSQFAMVGIFSFSHYLLPLWMSYWRALGCDTFYLFYNGPPQHVPLLQQELQGFEGSVVLINWQVIHWLSTEPDDITHGQPIAINSAFQRWRHLHAFMAFYDTDELLVTPGHNSLGDFVAAYSALRGPFTALRSMCSWSLLTNLSQHNLSSIADVRLEHLAVLPSVRSLPGGREKYLLNVSAAAQWGVRFINLHGVYSHQSNRPGDAEVMVPEGALPAYHMHLLNKDQQDTSQKNDYREVFVPKPGQEIKDNHLQELVVRAVKRRISRKEEEGRRRRAARGLAAGP